MTFIDRLAGTEEVEIHGFAIIYSATIKGDGYEIGTLGQSSVQANYIPPRLEREIREFLVRRERVRNGLPIKHEED